MHLEPQTTPQVCLLLERDQQPLLPTLPWHPRQGHLEVDSALHNLRSISGQQSRSQPLLLDHNLLLGVRSRQQCGAGSSDLWTGLRSGLDFD